jgi:hypothetical protein
LADDQAGQEAPYERLLGDAMDGDTTLFTRQDAVEAAWAAVDPVLKNHHRTIAYQPGSWGPKEAAVLIEPDGRWHNPWSAPPEANKVGRKKISTAGRPMPAAPRKDVSDRRRRVSSSASKNT